MVCVFWNDFHYNIPYFSSRLGVVIFFSTHPPHPWKIIGDHSLWYGFSQGLFTQIWHCGTAWFHFSLFHRKTSRVCFVCLHSVTVTVCPCSTTQVRRHLSQSRYGKLILITHATVGFTRLSSKGGPPPNDIGLSFNLTLVLFPKA